MHVASPPTALAFPTSARWEQRSLAPPAPESVPIDVSSRVDRVRRAGVRGAVGEHQVEGARTALGMAYGANSQYFSMWVVADSLQPFG